MPNRDALDQKDFSLIDYLRRDGRGKIGDISKSTGIPRATVFERISKLTGLGIIKNFTVSLDYEKLGLPVMAYVMLSYDSESGVNQNILCESLAQMDNIIGVSILSGEWDIIVLTVQKSIRDLSTFVLDKLRNMKGISRTQTFTVFQSFK
ncbi:MAG: Lrp/AsnC family transcriptional regulator [Candidatus Thermoplasmatota archaeon]|jgi:DNA-binding Lrp family transcriptional regulator|nr:Lrp/AsnC family transcriptional regulator [Candidatus Thermoplasmatota archaeon]MCL5730881.1 Lrp/AsnC family transcriptional regulator [Candidatus Thermoplasmatota archaeon]